MEQAPRQLTAGNLTASFMQTLQPHNSLAFSLLLKPIPSRFDARSTTTAGPSAETAAPHRRATPFVSHQVQPIHKWERPAEPPSISVTQIAEALRHPTLTGFG